jgi:putative Mn2+ efflux pump MntP
MISLLFIALGLSMDAFAVSVSSGISIQGLRPVHAIRASFCFGLFQFLMPLAGWYLGSACAAYIEAFDHWIAFVLLAFIGGKMLVEALRRKAEDPARSPGENAAEAAAAQTGDIRNLKTLLILAVATSIDALAASISLSIMGHGVWGSAAIIGGVTFLVCLSGFECGRRIGLALEKWAQIAGGIVLIGIGVKILVEHLSGQ